MAELRQRQVAKSSPSSAAAQPPILKDMKSKEKILYLSQDQCFVIQPLLVFIGMVTIRFLSVDLAILADCDEVFNYWEPTHYLSHGFGMQTWEYSPTYAIRSWSYVGLHAVISRTVAKLLSATSKVQEFYYLRAVFALFCSLCETKLYETLSLSFGSEIGAAFLFVSATSAGIFGAGVSYLPSTFAMYFAALGMASFLSIPRRPSLGIFCFAVGGILGWPFALALAVPFALDSAFRGRVGSTFMSRITPMIKGVISSAALLGIVVGIDSYAYGKLVLVPLNIVLYNVFGGSGKGPDLYGTEPWWFYIANLLLNFNVSVVLALLAAPLVAVSHAIGLVRINNFSVYAASGVFYLWLAIFSAQPHKEERFMFPAYPALCVSAAISLGVIYRNIGAAQEKATSETVKLVVGVGRLLLFAGMAVSAVLSASRISALSGYSAPLRVLNPPPPKGGAIPATGAPAANLTLHLSGNVCYGKEWYRFPSSYFLPEDGRLKFVKSRFDGLLPGEFMENQEKGDKHWARPGIWTVPEGMNDENKEDLSKYVDIKQCDYLVDSYFPSPAADEKDELEPAYILQTGEWNKIYCEPFLDASKTPWLGRVLHIYRIKDQRVWGEYCLLGRNITADKHW